MMPLDDFDVFKCIFLWWRSTRARHLISTLNEQGRPYAPVLFGPHMRHATPIVFSIINILGGVRGVKDPWCTSTVDHESEIVERRLGWGVVLDDCGVSLRNDRKEQGRENHGVLERGRVHDQSCYQLLCILLTPTCMGTMYLPVFPTVRNVRGCVDAGVSGGTRVLIF